MSTARISRLGWYACRAALMSLAEMAWRARDQAVRAAWSPRQVTRQQLTWAVGGVPAPLITRLEFLEVGKSGKSAVSRQAISWTTSTALPERAPESQAEAR